MNKLHLLLTLLLLAPQLTHTQEREPAWRVINTISPTTVPDYNAQPNPFPIQQAPVEVVVEVVDEEALARAETRAQLISKLRDVLLKNNAYTPNFEPFTPRGYLTGRNGARVLVGKNWLSEGAQFKVTVSGTQTILNMLNQLKALDPKIGQEMARDINRIMPNGSTVTVTIIQLNPQQLTLQDAKGRRYTLPIN